MMTDPEARGVLRAAFAVRGMHSPSLTELQAAQAIARFESAYGGWPKGAPPSNNWGAVQCVAKPPCPAGCFEHPDTHADGTKYQGCFRAYPTPVEGATEFVRQLYRREGVPAALRSGDATRIADRMHATHYFELRPEAYAERIEEFAERVAEGMGEPLKVKRGAGAGGGISVGVGIAVAVVLWRVLSGS